MIGSSDGQVYESGYDRVADKLLQQDGTGTVTKINPSDYMTKQERLRDTMQNAGNWWKGNVTREEGQILDAIRTLPGDTLEQVRNFIGIPQGTIRNMLGIKVNRDYEVPYISGPSNDGKTVYVDKHVPTTATIDGKTFDTATPLSIHELTERRALEHYLKQGMPEREAYQKAHEDHAEPAENNWYIENGIDPRAADDWWSKINSKTEQEGRENHPPDLFKAPYPHHVVEGSKGDTRIDDPMTK